MRNFSQSMTSIVLVSLFTLIINCGGSSSSTAEDTEASLEEAAASVASLFSGLGSSESLSAAPSLSSGSSYILDATMETCNNLGRGPDKVIMTGRGYSATIGSVTDQIIVTENDFCEDSDGTANTGLASDGNPLFANFMIADTITGTCDSGTLSMAKGQGITRNVDGPATEIYGRFEINGNFLDCTLYLDSSGVMNGTTSSCSDSDHQAVTLTTSSTCTLSGDIARITSPITMEGHFAVSTDEAQTVAYDCHNFRNTVSDANGIMSPDPDCDAFDAYGFNIESFSIGYVVSGDANDWEFNRTATADDINNRIKMMRIAGYPVLASIDFLYVEDYDPSDPSSVADGADFPPALIANTTFQQEMATEIITLATDLEDLNVEILAPMSESDRVFASASLASAFFNTYLTEIAAHFTGELMWIGYAFDSQSTTDYNLTGFDYAAVNISPNPSHTTSSAFQTHVTTQLTNLEVIADHFSIPFFISNAGVWGDAIGNSYDWGTDAHALEAFQIMTDTSDTIGTDGIIYWEGAAGEVVFSTNQDIVDLIVDRFTP